MIAHKIH